MKDAYIVILEQDLDGDEAEGTLIALKQVRGVLDVVEVAEVLAASPRARANLRKALWDGLAELPL